MRVLDAFCGAGGASTGLTQAGYDVVGIEQDKDAAATHEAAGHATICADITSLTPQGIATEHGEFDGLWMSPPCQDFSLAGLRAGIYGDRGRLVMEVLRWSSALTPRFVACEQVPPVLPIWEWFAHALRQLGYRTWTGILSAEQFGVPQTRRRAILMARRDGVSCLPPAPTHTAYDYRAPDGGRYAHDGLFGEVLLPWVSMADALGMNGAVELHHERGAGMVERHGERPGRSLDEPSFAVMAGNQGSGTRMAWRQARDSGPGAEREPRDIEAPSYTIRSEGSGSHPAGVKWSLCNGTQKNACTRDIDEPSGTLFFGHQANDVSWITERPAMTIVGTRRSSEGMLVGRQLDGGDSHPPAVRVTVPQAAVLQGFPADYPWQGSRTSQYRQIGNAVPPPLAAAIGRTFRGVA